MIEKIYIPIIILYIFLFFGRIVEGRLTDVIQTDKGPVQGEIVKAVQNSSIEYSSFRGIPYANSPVGQLRFQPPVERDAWSETLLATSEAPACPQIDDTGSFYGTEQCLFLNVYSPWTSFNESGKELLSVMVWIYGGEFIIGEINIKKYGPDFLIAENVVIVAMNYRIGALGFLSLDIPEATGNMGLKDQVLALEWVQKNIEKFGGDPKKVTIFGQSAGSDCVLLHQISPASSGLFRGAIAMSGSPLNPWGFHLIPAAEAQAYDIATRLGFANHNKSKILTQLKTVTAEQIVRATSNETGVRFGLPSFRPTYENIKIAKDIFLSECPGKKYKSGNYSRIPVMLGFTNAETLAFTSRLKIFFDTINYGKVYLQSIGLNILDNIFGSNINISDVDENVIYSAINKTTDALFVAGIDSTQEYLAQNSPPVYYYRNSFDYKEARHRIDGINLNGCAHSDDLPQIWWQSLKRQPLDPGSRIGIQRMKMVKLWTNFAKYLNPTPNDLANHLLNVTWIPSGTSDLLLEIGNDKFTMEPQPTSFTVKTVELASKVFACLL